MSTQNPLTAPEPHATETWGERIARYENTPGWEQRQALEYDVNARAQSLPQWASDPMQALEDAAHEIIPKGWRWTIFWPVGGTAKLLITGLTWRLKE